MSDGARKAVQDRPFPIGRRRVLGGGLAGVGILLAGGVGGLPRAALAQDIRFLQIGTGTTGGTYFLIGGLLANAVSNPPGSRPCDRGGSCGVPGLIAVAQSTSGAVENVIAMRDGRMETGLVQADIAFAALRGKGPFADAPPFETLRSIANLYPETIHLVVRADGPVHTVAELKGRRVALGERGSGTLVSARALLEAHGLSERTVQPVYLSPGAASDRLIAGEVDAYFIIGGYPLPAVADLAQRLPIRLVPLAPAEGEATPVGLPMFTPATIEDGAYPDVAGVRSLSVGAQWCVRADIDAELVHGLTAALWHPTTAKLLEVHPRGASIHPDRALAGLAAPLHPGAERYYRESGLIGETASVELATPPDAPPAAAGSGPGDGPKLDGATMEKGDVRAPKPKPKPDPASAAKPGAAPGGTP
ncbi:MAG: hypothetical protein RLY86_2146 [Pseudomonadota bacterium]|jgi:TRAP transporter TAXI family solute receptor